MTGANAVATAAVIDLAAERQRRRPLRCGACGGEISAAPGYCERAACRRLIRRGKWLIFDPFNGETIGEPYGD